MNISAAVLTGCAWKNDTSEHGEGLILANMVDSKG